MKREAIYCFLSDKPKYYLLLNQSFTPAVSSRRLVQLELRLINIFFILLWVSNNLLIMYYLCPLFEIVSVFFYVCVCVLDSLFFLRVMRHCCSFEIRSWSTLWLDIQGERSNRGQPQVLLTLKDFRCVIYSH